jgi:hypothetical protein
MTIGGIVWSSLHTFASPSECVSIRAGSAPDVAASLSASSHGIRAASTACISHPASTPIRPESPTSAAGYYTDNMFRPRGLSPPRRLAPRASCEFVAPHCLLEVRCVSCPVVHMHTAEAALCGTGPTFPRSAFSHPSKDSPHLQPHRVATAVALLTLPCEVFPDLRQLFPLDSRSSRLLYPPLPECSLSMLSTNAAAFKALLR